MRLFILLVMLTGLLANPAIAQTVPPFDPYAPPDTSQESPLEGSDLTTLFVDQTHRGYYDAGDWDEEETPAFTEIMNADGTTIHTRNGITSIGQWRTKNDLVCFTYDDLNGGCFNVYQRGTCYFVMSAFSNDLVAVTVIGDDVPNCEPSYA